MAVEEAVGLVVVPGAEEAAVSVVEDQEAQDASWESEAEEKEQEAFLELAG
jgi:hypothetical protein